MLANQATVNVINPCKPNNSWYNQLPIINFRFWMVHEVHSKVEDGLFRFILGFVTLFHAHFLQNEVDSSIENLGSGWGWRPQVGFGRWFSGYGFWEIYEVHKVIRLLQKAELLIENWKLGLTWFDNLSLEPSEVCSHLAKKGTWPWRKKGQWISGRAWVVALGWGIESALETHSRLNTPGVQTWDPKKWRGRFGCAK